MGTELFKGFGVDIAAEVLSALGPGVPEVTLLSRSLGPEDPTDLTAGRPVVETPHTCKGFIDTYDSRRMGESLIQQGTRVIVFIGDSLPSGVIPQDEDRVIAEGTTYHITGPIVRDPAAATYVAEARG